MANESVRYLRGTQEQFQAYIEADRIVSHNYYLIYPEVIGQGEPDLYIGKQKINNQAEINTILTNIEQQQIVIETIQETQRITENTVKQNIQAIQQLQKDVKESIEEINTTIEENIKKDLESINQKINDEIETLSPIAKSGNFTDLILDWDTQIIFDGGDAGSHEPIALIDTMNTKVFNNARFTPKGDIEANWNKAIGFVPLKKEIIIYLPDSTHTAARIKIGDGVTNVNDLPFIGNSDGDFASKEWVTEYGIELSEVLKQHIDTKYDQTGGIISGDVAIQGNLSVTGTTTTKDTETLQVKDNVIVANADGAEVIEDSGFAIKTSETTAYGIMYDPVGDGVKIGLGSFDENGKFIYDEGEAQFLATRADNITDGNLPQWDNEKKQFVDSGEKIGDYVKNTDYPTGAERDHAGVIRVNNAVQGLTVNPVNGLLTTYPANQDVIDGRHDNKFYNPAYYCGISPRLLDYAIKVGMTTNTETWTDDETQAARDLIGAVGKNEHASESSYGLVKTYYNKWSSGLTFIRDMLAIYAAEKNDIAAKVNTTCPIVPSNVEYATMSALADCQKPELWTDDSTVDGEVVKGTKTKALELLGAMKKPKNPPRNSLVGMNAYGNVSTTTMVHESAAPWSIPLRDSDGCIKTATPKASGDSANKDYIDNLPDNLTLTDEEKAKWCGMMGALLKGTSSDILCSNGTTFKWDYGVIGGSLIRRYGNGSARVKMPSKIEDESDYDITNRGYVNNLPDYLALTEDTTDENGEVVQGTKTKWQEWLGIGDINTALEAILGV